MATLSTESTGFGGFPIGFGGSYHPILAPMEL
ncbi:unnamed protein product [Tuwongella immobilis]|uniref:Uncharacterized protein n=1 Tax=Tuwongella immobilis TaxID=692036 RepID=A0A6C2YWD1_9BACT|nr:unnamed protein product [Tuwongella immobilis]VTS08282.1 unnamed protein product [Tuwongella immobilis]